MQFLWDQVLDLPDAASMPASVWTYRFSPMQEREQKRQYETSGNILRDGLAWTYTLLGGDNKQLATYNGVQGEFCGQNAVWMWPVEHNSYGPAQTRIITRPNGFKEFVIQDHLGSSRLTISAEGDVLQRSDYEPFGSSLANEGVGSRTSFIGREEDGESGLGFYGVRLYEPEYGRFTSVDPLWGEYLSWNSYQYSLNTPLVGSDPTGRVVTVKSSDGQSEYTFDGKNLIDADGNVYTGDDEFLVGTRKTLVSLLELGGDPSGDLRTLMMSDLKATFQLAREGAGSATEPNVEEGQDEGIRMSTYGVMGQDGVLRTIGTDVTIMIDPLEYGSCEEGKTVLFAHENRHGYHQITGTRSYESEKQGLRGENAARHLLGLPMRLNHGNSAPYKWDEVVPWWVPLP